MTHQPQTPQPTVDRDRLVEEVVPLMLTMAQRLKQHASARAAEFGLTLSQAKVLLALEPGQAVPMSTLAAQLDYDASNLTGLVDRLEARDALERRPDADDRRVKNLVVTEEGVRLQQAFRQRVLDHDGSFGYLSAAQLRDLRDLLRLALENG